MTLSVADRVKHRLPRPVRCDECGSPRVALQNTKMMNFRRAWRWSLVWFCSDCTAFVGCHEGTDIPLGFMAGLETRHARYEAHQVFDPMWKRGPMSKDQAYQWMAKALFIPYERAHIGMLSKEQCEVLIQAVRHYKHHQRHNSHWSQKERKRRRR